MCSRAFALGLCALSLLIAPLEAANIVLLSVDDGVTSSAIKVAYEETVLASGARNPNGCPPPITWFSDDRSDCDAVNEVAALGHELASHTRSHPNTVGDLSYDELASEIGGQRDWLAGCGIPADLVQGFRAPYYQTSEAMGQVLQDLGFLYDSSLTGKDASPAAPMDDYFPFTWCQSSDCKGWDELSIWEVPAYALAGSGKRSDPVPLNGKSVLQRFQEDFEDKRGTGAPTSILVHENYLEYSSSRAAVSDFLGWALEQDDTWALTYTQYISWLQNGTESSPGDVAGGC